MAAALSRVLTLPVVEIITSFMEFAPGVPDTDELLQTLMLQIRKKYVDEIEYCTNETSIRVGEKYAFRLWVDRPHEEEDDEDEDALDYSLVGKILYGKLEIFLEGDLAPEPYTNGYAVGGIVGRPATPQGFRYLRSKLLGFIEHAERDGLCPKAPGRRLCLPSTPRVRYLRAAGTQYCTHCCLHMAFRGSDVQ